MCDMSHITCHMSQVTCHLSHYYFTFHKKFKKKIKKQLSLKKIGQRGGASWWSVCYQRNLPYLVSSGLHIFLHYVILHTKCLLLIMFSLLCQRFCLQTHFPYIFAYTNLRKQIFCWSCLRKFAYGKKSIRLA